ncbi:MAG: MFS transporter, partial [Candidatus Woesebacteria bacterium]|nr:MFS transporter [Candidatus Woesebacteria bacterium]
WSKVILFSLTLFLLRLADAVISFWAPNQIQSSLNSSVWMGIIISFQSLVGFGADLLFPTLLRTTKTKRLIFWAIIMSALTSFFLTASVVKPFIAIFLITMTLWGIYYEFVAFANYQFMGSVVPPHMRSAAWGVAGTFLNMAYFLGPLIAAAVLLKSYILAEGIILVFLVLALLLLSIFKGPHDVPAKIDFKDVNPWVELKHWLTLSKHIWPVMILSLLLGFIDSTFWTTGAIWTEKLAKINYLGGLFLPFYQLPAIFLGVVIAGWGIYKGKKILTEKFLIVAGIFLIGLALSDTVYWQLSMVLLASAALSICYPLLDGVYTDIVARMGKEKKDLIGLTSSVVNVSYVVWPPVVGVVAGLIGERLTFSFVGVLVVIVSVILLFVTPKKLRLPQEEIKSWEH